MKQTTFTFRTTQEKVEQAQKKANDVPLSVIMRKLLEMWLAGEIEIRL